MRSLIAAKGSKLPGCGRLTGKPEVIHSIFWGRLPTAAVSSCHGRDYMPTVTHSAAFSICETFHAIMEWDRVVAPYSQRTDTSADAFHSSTYIHRRGTAADPRS